MNSRQRVKAALTCVETDRAPWVPFVGCHGGALIGHTARQYLSSADAVCAGAAEAARRYRPDGLPVLFDLQIEAEALGCSLQWADENPPAVVSHPLEDGRRTHAHPQVPRRGDGRLAMAMEAASRLRDTYPHMALYGLITGPFTLATHLGGTGIFLQMLENGDELKSLLAFCTEVATSMADRYIETGCDVIAVVDPMSSQIGPDQFAQFLTVAETAVFNHIRQRGALSSFFVCGFAQQNITAMAQCGPDNISVDENIPLDFVRDICLPRGISFGGNLELTGSLLLGTVDDARRNAVRCLDIGGNKGFLLAPGCDLPYATPPRNLEAVAAVVNDPYEREVARTLALTTAPDDIPRLPDYATRQKVTIDIVTLDSASCAPCQYMVNAVREAAKEVGSLAQWEEHSIKTPQGIRKMKALGVEKIPTICMNGAIEFVSTIPAGSELVARINKHAAGLAHNGVTGNRVGKG